MLFCLMPINIIPRINSSAITYIIYLWHCNTLAHTHTTKCACAHTHIHTHINMSRDHTSFLLLLSSLYERLHPCLKTPAFIHPNDKGEEHSIMQCNRGTITNTNSSPTTVKHTQISAWTNFLFPSSQSFHFDYQTKFEVLMFIGPCIILIVE